MVFVKHNWQAVNYSLAFPSAYPHIPPRVPLYGFPWNLVFDNFMKKIYRENSKFYFNRTKIWGNLREDQSKLHCCRIKRNSPHRQRCEILDIFILLTEACSSALHTEHIVAFPVQQWLRGRAKILCIHCLSSYEIPLVSVTKNCRTIPIFNHIRSQWGPLSLSHKLILFISYLYNINITNN